MPSSSTILSLFQSLSGASSASIEREVERHRLLALLGAVLVLTLGTLYDATNPGAVNPARVRLVLAALFVGLFGLSYAVEGIQRHLAAWMQGVIYVLMGWFVFITAANGFAGDYDLNCAVLGFEEVSRAVRGFVWDSRS